MSDIELTYTRHARRQLRRRRVSDPDVRAVVSAPEVSYDDDEKRHLEAEIADGRWIRVVLAIDAPGLVITVIERGRRPDAS